MNASEMAKGVRRIFALADAVGSMGYAPDGSTELISKGGNERFCIAYEGDGFAAWCEYARSPEESEWAQCGDGQGGTAEDGIAALRAWAQALNVQA